MKILDWEGTPAFTPLSAPERPRFLSVADCRDIMQRIANCARGGGCAMTAFWSNWTGNVRWARNRITTSGDVRNDYVMVQRNINGAMGSVLLINDTSDAALVAATRRAERLAFLEQESPGSDLTAKFPNEPAPAPALFFEATYQLDADQRASAAHRLVQSVANAGMLSAGYIEVSAHSIATLDTLGHERYFPYTWARYSVTVRDPQGTGSGWAGVDWPDWTKIDGPALSATALDKCLKSRDPVAVEPGRYTAILEPQAVCDLVSCLTFRSSALELDDNQGPNGAFSTRPPSKKAMRGEKVIDQRITITADPLDPELGFPPFNPAMGGNFWFGKNLLNFPVYHPVTWIDHGILNALAYDRDFAIDHLAQNTGLPNAGGFRMSGGETSLQEMIATTKRGLLVTRFDRVDILDYKSVLVRGYTRDGLWLIENGKIVKPVKNMAFTESVLFTLNNVEQLGIPQRAFHPKADRLANLPKPVIVPALKVRDFSFTALADSI